MVEWLLVITLHLPPEKVAIEDMRFPSYEACLEAADKVWSGELVPVYLGKPLNLKEDRAARTTFAVIHKDITCEKVEN